MTNRKMMIRAALACATAACGVLAVAPAIAQTTTASVLGTVAGATSGTVTARSTTTGFQARAAIGAGGDYALTGLTPGTYTLTAPGPGGATITREVTIGIGQNLTFDFGPAVASQPVDDKNAIVVTGSRLVETRTSEVATNITPEQIRVLPQTDRNFLSFAALAPGVRYSDSETDKGFSSGASTASQVNVFVDGQSLKNGITEGGIAGQQNSRGNPFPQLGVQEFRVLTQNYKAEYEQAAAAIITAVTKSGTNQFHGELIGAYTDRSLSETDAINRGRNLPKPAFERKQYGGALGGPIIKDHLFFFFTYEGNDQNRAFNVQARGTPAQQAAVEASSGRKLSEFAGSFVSPFRAKLYFGKLTWQPDDRNQIDLSYSRREETDVQGFGDTTSFETAENKKNLVEGYNLRWKMRNDRVLNEVSADYINYNFNPTSINPNLPTFDYAGVIRFGGKDSTRTIHQKTYTFRDDLTVSHIDWHGSHIFKGGFKLALLDFDYIDAREIQPIYFFNQDASKNLDFSFPSTAILGTGNPRIKDSDIQLGLFVQDDWKIDRHLTLNLGVRWDYETNQFNNSYVTPSNAVAVLQGLRQTNYFKSSDFISNGSNRDPYPYAIQPRIGLSYDLHGDQRWVIFGGYGRYFDRNAFNNSRDERFRQQFTDGRFEFSRDGLPRNGSPTIVFDPKYLTRDGLLALQAQALTGLPELFAVQNSAKPPKTDQFSLGVRHRMGPVVASVTGSYIIGKNGFTNLFGSRDPVTGNCCDTALARQYGFGNVLVGRDDLSTRYWGLYVQIQKPYTERSGWGLDVAYTLSKAQQDGNDLFSLDKAIPSDYGYRDRPGTERHVLVLSGQVDLPFGFRFSTLSTFSSGSAFQVFDATKGFDTNQVVIRTQYPEANCIGIFARCEVNLTLEKDFKLFRTHQLGFAVDVLNAFNNDNYGSFPGFVCCGGSSANFGDIKQAGSVITLPRRFQFRASYRF